MELTHDWAAFQSMFAPSRRILPTAGNALAMAAAAGAEAAAIRNPLHVVSETGLVLMVFGDPEDWTPWAGKAVDQLALEHPQRDVIVHERAELDEAIAKSLQLPHFYDQTRFLRESSPGRVLSNGRKPASSGPMREHFVLEAIRSWWGKVLPSAYGFFVRLEGQPERDLFLLVRRGKIELFHEPDLASMGAERCRVPADVVKYLSEKHLVPVQGLFVPAQEWADWAKMETPWRRVAAAVRANRAKLVPFRAGVATLMASRAFLGL